MERRVLSNTEIIESFPAVASAETDNGKIDLPEWAIQRAAIANNKEKWDDFSFEERTCKGWLLPYLYMIDSGKIGRWQYWLKALDEKAIPSDPIPYIDFLQSPDRRAEENLKKCLQGSIYGFDMSGFLEWILWGFGEGDQRSKISAKANEYLYRTFNLGLMIHYPHDYMGHLLAQKKAGFWNNPNAFFPTPHSICKLMTDMQLGQQANKIGDVKTKKVLDPCVGSGRMLMYASNHCLFLYGNDVDRDCVMACKINGYLYMPWLVKPFLPPTSFPIETKATETANLSQSNLKITQKNKNVNLSKKQEQLLLF